jgi:predicted transcriptional regulator
MALNDTVTRSLRLPPDLNRKLTQLAQRESSSVNHEIIVAVRAHIDRHLPPKGTRTP